ncbi:hypothetical protein M5689_001236 [Euphorbia peplus]|nr:hypothetical protein M5689_001236 [Euphorbia peplus]
MITAMKLLKQARKCLKLAAVKRYSQKLLSVQKITVSSIPTKAGKSHGYVTLPCEAKFMEYAIALIKHHVNKDATS